TSSRTRTNPQHTCLPYGRLSALRYGLSGLGPKQFQDCSHDRVRLYCQQRAGAGFQLHFAFSQRLFADGNAYRKADQLGIFEFHAGAFLAVVEDDLHSSTGKFRVDFFGQSYHRTVRSHGQRRDANRVRRNRHRPDNAVPVVALLDDGLKRARHADAVAAHDGRLLFAGLVEEQRAERLAVFCAQLKDVADFNRPADFERLTALSAGFARLNQPQVGPARNLNVAINRNIAQMETVFIRAGGHPDGAAQGFVGVNRDFPRLNSRGDSAEAARMRAEFSENFLGGGGAKLSRPQNADQLRFIQLMIAAQQDKNRFALDEVDQCLDLAAGGDIVRRLGECFDGEDARRRELFNFGFRISDFGFRRSGGRLLDVGRVAATFA